jgi:hypothetical protein
MDVLDGIVTDLYNMTSGVLYKLGLILGHVWLHRYLYQISTFGCHPSLIPHYVQSLIAMSGKYTWCLLKSFLRETSITRKKGIRKRALKI